MLALNNDLALAIFQWDGKGPWLHSRSKKALVAVGAWRNRHLGYGPLMIPAHGLCPEEAAIFRPRGRESGQAGIWLCLVGNSLILRIEVQFASNPPQL